MLSGNLNSSLYDLPLLIKIEKLEASQKIPEE